MRRRPTAHGDPLCARPINESRNQRVRRAHCRLPTTRIRRVDSWRVGSRREIVKGYFNGMQPATRPDVPYAKRLVMLSWSTLELPAPMPTPFAVSISGTRS